MEKGRVGLLCAAHSRGSVIFLPQRPWAAERCRAALGGGAARGTRGWDGACPSPPMPRSPRRRWEEKEATRDSAHTPAPRCRLPRDQHLPCYKCGLKVLPTPPTAEHSPCSVFTELRTPLYGHSRRRCAPCRTRRKMPWEALPLVGKSCLWGSYLPFLLSG